MKPSEAAVRPDSRYVEHAPLPNAKRIDLADMARRALRYLSLNPMEDHGYQCRFSFAPLKCPPLTPDTFWFNGTIDPALVDPVTVGDTESRNDTAFNMMREITGDYETGRAAQEAVHERLAGYIRDDVRYRGLCWAPVHCMFVADGFRYAMYWASGLLLQSECHRHALEPARHSLDTARRLFEGIRDSARHYGDAAFFPHGGAGFDDAERQTVGGENYPLVMGPLCEYWLASGDGECLSLLHAAARGFVRDLHPYHRHRADGGVDGHNHVQLHALRGMAQFGYLTGNAEYLDWVRGVYRYYRRWALDTGWLPEIRTDPEHDYHSETCLNADMLEIEVWLALAGDDSLWDRVDRSFRNYFCPAQFEVTPELERLYRRVNRERPAAAVEEGLRTLRELEGGFISAMTPNDRICRMHEGAKHWGTVPLGGETLLFDMMGCCPPEGARALYLVWKYAVTEEDGLITVRLPYDANREAVSVRTGLPQRGRVTAEVRKDAELLVRVPRWAPRGGVAVEKNGELVPVLWDGAQSSFVRVRVRAGDRVTVSYPLLDEWQTVSWSPEAYPPGEFSFHWVGNSVVGVSPEGEYLPLYRESVF